MHRHSHNNNRQIHVCVFFKYFFLCCGDYEYHSISFRFNESPNRARPITHLLAAMRKMCNKTNPWTPFRIPWKHFHHRALRIIIIIVVIAVELILHGRLLSHWWTGKRARARTHLQHARARRLLHSIAAIRSQCADSMDDVLYVCVASQRNTTASVCYLCVVCPCSAKD